MKHFLFKQTAALLFMLLCHSEYIKSQALIINSYSLTSSTQTFVTPNCTSDLSITISGGAGANAGWNIASPAMVYVVMTPTPGQILYINVGGMGTGTLGGWNGGGNGGVGSTTSGGGGGGASDIRLGGNSLSDRIIVMGGGGGSGSTPQAAGYGGSAIGVGWLSTFNCPTLNGSGGNGGWGTAAGGAGACAGGTATAYGTGGAGGGLTSGGGVSGSGAGGFGQAGSLGQGGNGGGTIATYGGSNGGVNGAGGGGGGYYGGAGGMCGNYPSTANWPLSGGGGGGASYINPAYFYSITPGGLPISDGYIHIKYTYTSTNLSVTGPTNSCANNSVNISVSGASTYTWLPVNNFSGSNSTTISDSPSLTTVYTVQGTSTLNCAFAKTFTVSVDNTVPSLTISNSATLTGGGVCPNQTVSLFASGAQSYTWTGGVISGTPFVPNANNQTYVVTGSNACGTNTAATSVSLHPLPTINILPISSTLCPGSSATLLAAGSATAYLWSGGSSSITNGVAFTPTSSNIYTVVGTSGNGCMISSIIPINLVPSPTITIVASSYTTCSQQTVNIIMNGAASAISYSWLATDGTNTLSGNTQSLIDGPAFTTTYSVVGSSSLGCTSSASLSVLVYPKPILQITSTKSLICNNESSTLTASGANSYNWDVNANSAVTASASVNPTASMSSSFIYTVQGTHTLTGCSNTKTIMVSVFIPTLTISGNTITCPGNSVSLSASNGVSYIWHTNSGNPHPFATISPTLYSADIFTLTANSASSGVICPTTKTIGVDVYPNPTITAVPEKTIICLNESVKITANGGITYNWSNNMNGSSITVTPHTGTIYYGVTGINANGCKNTAIVEIVVSECTGINQWTGAKDGALVYPNPNNGDFTIKTSFEIQLSIVNELGQIVKTVHLTEDNGYRETLTNLAKGVYFISDQKEGAQIHQKIIVSK